MTFEEWWSSQKVLRLGSPRKDEYREIFEAGRRAEREAISELIRDVYARIPCGDISAIAAVRDYLGEREKPEG